MDGERFDAVTGILGRTHGRRGALRLLGGALAAVALGQFDAGEARRKGGRRTGQKSGDQLECELLGGEYRKRLVGGYSCDYPDGLHKICDGDGHCLLICVVKEGCDCQTYDNAFCQRAKQGSSEGHVEGDGEAAPIADEVVPTTGSSGSTRPGRPGQGAAAGTGGTVKK